MKLILGSLAIAALLAGCSKPEPSPASGSEAKPAQEEANEPKVSRDAQGNAVIAMDDEVQGDLGIQVTNPPALQFAPELKGFGLVLDPAPLSALLTELASANAAYSASSNELSRLKTLEAQGNSSARAIQAAEAAALRDQLAVQSALDRLRLGWGKTLAESCDLPVLAQSLASLEAVLVRVEVPVGQPLPATAEARIVGLSDETASGKFVGLAPSVDSQYQGRGMLFLVQPNHAQFQPDQAITGYLKVSGQPQAGVVIPRDAVVRTEGAGWVYVLDSKTSEAFTRIQVPLDRPLPSGWFVSQGIAAGDYVVVKGAQELLSIELKGAAE